jgi:pimeloyl-ACP methyl ester carboxylesterase
VWATTKDDWTLYIRRFQPKVLDPHRAPVVLCHGLNCNDRLWDLSPDVSLARYLAERGFDVWVPALRGAGQSDKPGINMIRRVIRPVFPELPGSISFRTIDPLSLNWTMDDYVRYDVPAILAKVRAETGAPTVHWVGHSLGGIIIYAYAEQFGDSELASICTLGAPLTIPQPPNNFLRALQQNKDLFKIVSLLLPASVPVSLMVLDQRSGIVAAMYNPANVDHSVLQEFFTRDLEDIPVGVLDQLVRAVETGELHSHNGQLNYAQLLEKVTVPTFVAGGLVDVVGCPESIRYVYSHVASQKKEFHIFCVVNNDTIDYGHMDLVFGRYAPRDVFPAIERWLSGHPLATPFTPPSAEASRQKASLP